MTTVISQHVRHLCCHLEFVNNFNFSKILIAASFLKLNRKLVFTALP